MQTVNSTNYHYIVTSQLGIRIRIMFLYMHVCVSFTNSVIPVLIIHVLDPIAPSPQAPFSPWLAFNKRSSVSMLSNVHNYRYSYSCS